MDTSETSRFYDRRGAHALSDEVGQCGSDSVPPFLAEPYVHLDGVIRQLHAAGKTSFLDLCCGRGAYSVFAATVGFEVVGVDISAMSIAAAARLAEANGVLDRCRFVLGDALTSVTHESFDVIFIGSSLYYLDLHGAIDFVREHLQPDGDFICIETNGGNMAMKLYRRLRARIRRDRDIATLTQLLGQREIAQLRVAFPGSQVRYYGFLTLAGRFAPSPLRRLYQPIANRADELLLNRVGLHWLSFRFVFEGSVRR